MNKFTGVLIIFFLLIAGTYMLKKSSGAYLYNLKHPVVKNYNFSKRGVLKPMSVANNKFKFIYEEPGAPAMEVTLDLNEASDCTIGKYTDKCLTLNSPLMDKVQGKKVIVDGFKSGSRVTVGQLTVEIETVQKFGYIRSVKHNGSNLLVSIDEIEFLSGNEAMQAIIEDMNCEPERITECAPSMNNDFYIRNRVPDETVYNLTLDTEIKILENIGSPVLKDIDLSAFLISSALDRSSIKDTPFMFLVEGMSLILVEQQYTP